MKNKAFALMATLFVTFTLSAKTLFTVRSPEGKNDTRFNFEHELLEKILQASREKYGDYSIVLSQPMNHSRMRAKNTFEGHPNLFYTDSWTNKLSKNVVAIPIPIQRGIVGHRLMIINKENKEEFSKITSFTDLIGKSILQGRGWQDIGLLKSNGLRVEVGNLYSGLFAMIQNKHADIFLRGAHEIYKEIKEFQKSNPDITLLDNTLIYYPFPRVFYTATKNKKAIERVTYGLKKIMKNDTFINIWNKHYAKDFFKVKNVKHRIKLVNPALPKLFDSSKYYWISVK